MHRSIFAALAAVLFSVVEAQSVSLSSLPKCAVSINLPKFGERRDI